MSGRYDDVARAIAQKDAGSALRLIFERDRAVVRFGRKLESEVWDFKADCPKLASDTNSENAWAHIAADVIGFHNNRGGLIIFGINDHTFEFTGATRTLDTKQFNDRIRPYVGDTIWVDYLREYIRPDQRYLGVALIPPRGPAVARFKKSAPSISGKRHFERSGTAIREGDSTKIYDPPAADRITRGQSEPVFGDRYSVDEPYFRILAPEYLHFLQRGALGVTLEQSMRDTRVSVTSLIGVGGLGKTALATWAVNRAYDRDDYAFIVSTTAKDRELSASGILGLTPQLTSYEDLLDQISDVLGVPEIKDEPMAVREKEVRALIEGGNGLLFVDNLETVDDKRLISFLDDLPTGVKALVTSRRNSVRIAARPINVGPLADNEIVNFIKLLSTERPYSHVGGIRDAEALSIGKAWDGIPLALRWSIARTRSVPELMRQAEATAQQKLHGEQLLEFSFRRVFETLTVAERSVLESLSVLEQPIPTEAVVAASGSPDSQVLDALDELVDDAMVQRVFDPDRNDYCYTILSVTRSFARNDMQRRPENARGIQRRLTSWFEATDVANEDERLVVREIRSGRNADDTALVDLARTAEKRGDLDGAEKLYRQALARNPRSWRAARGAAEFFKQKRRNTVEALAMYEIAGANAPRAGSDRMLIFREWGLLLRDSGRPGATTLAEEQLVKALKEAPNDAIARHAMATCLDKRGAYRKVIDLLEPTLQTQNEITMRKSWPLLLRAFDKTNEKLKYLQLRTQLDSLAENP